MSGEKCEQCDRMKATEDRPMFGHGDPSLCYLTNDWHCQEADARIDWRTRARRAEGLLAHLHSMLGNRASHGAKGNTECLAEWIADAREGAHETAKEHAAEIETLTTAWHHAEQCAEDARQERDALRSHLSTYDALAAAIAAPDATVTTQERAMREIVRVWREGRR